MSQHFLRRFSEICARSLVTTPRLVLKRTICCSKQGILKRLMRRADVPELARSFLTISTFIEVRWIPLNLSSAFMRVAAGHTLERSKGLILSKSIAAPEGSPIWSILTSKRTRIRLWHVASDSPCAARQLDCYEYTVTANPPILHRKETFLPPDHPLYDRFARLTRQEERHGLLASAAGIGTRSAWENRLADAGFMFRGHRLVRRPAGNAHPNENRTATSTGELSDPKAEAP